MFLVQAIQPVPYGPGGAEAGSGHRGHLVGHGEPSVIAGVIARAVLVAVTHQASHPRVHASVLDRPVAEKQQRPDHPDLRAG